MPHQQIPCSHTLADSFSLFALFSTLASFVFNNLRTLFAKHRGCGYLCDISALPAPARSAGGSRRYHCRYFVAPLFCRPFIFIHLQIPPHRASICNTLCFHPLTNPFSATSLYSHLYKTPGCGIQIMAKHRLNHARPGGSCFFRAIKEFDSYERNFGLESRCWSIIRATNRAAQPREIRPNTRVKTKAVTGRSPKPAAGGVAATKGGSQQNESDPGFLARHTRSRIPRRCRQSWHPRTKILEWRRVRILQRSHQDV